MQEPSGNWKRNIVPFLASQTISLFGSSLVQYAIMWHITLEAQSGVMMTLAVVCGFLPTFFLSPFAGVWADRYSRKALIVLSDSLIALSTLVLAVLFALGHDALWLLLVASAIRALGSAVHAPAVGALIPQLVPEDRLTKVNATFGSIGSLVALVSPMLSGALLTVTTIESIFFIDVATAAIAILILQVFLRVPVHAKAAAGNANTYLEDMREGLAYIGSHAYVRAFFAFCAIFFLLVAPAAFLTPLQVTRSFGADVWRLTAIEIAFSAGMLAGGIVMASWGGFRNRIHTMALSCMVIAVCTLALGIVPAFEVYLAFMGLTGIALPIFNTPAAVLLQEKVEADFLGRVFGVLGMISSSMMPLGMLVFGPMADIFRIEWLLVGTGFLLLGQSVLMLGNKVLVEAGRPRSKSALST